jgi:hypothetical protein
MADIELVIKIPEEMMSYINKNEFNAISEAAYGSMAMLAIQNGTPLPKGHGRLIDKDALGEKLHRYTEAPYQYALTVFNESPIIINADRSNVGEM